ncbi:MULTISPECIES: hypothetical protein [unclassified Streptomyces]|uniref:hypothetical protein n=1 Tax=unclassified Streptomyces TaxID=2593676 RepID=UPI00093FFFCB|nr:hypothetical protein [Streptomyces sp. CB02058]OKI88921.1 hypothetical protein AMK10_32030 [Streptomyces sp. CB02058]
MSLRPTLRTAVLAAVAVGAVLLPSTAAVADESPTPAPVESTATPSPVPAEEGAEPAPVSTPVPAESVPAGTMPRGGVDAGERTATGTDGAALYGSAAGAVLLAGAAGFVLRRRSAARHNG